MQSRRDFLASVLATAALAATSRASATCPTGGRVLEVFFEGGLSVRQTLAVSTSSADHDRAQLLASNQYSPVYGMADSSSALRYHATQALAPLFSVQRRFRLIELTHSLFPHEAAIPLALTGTTTGRQQHAGTGAHANAVCGVPGAFVINSAHLGRAAELAATATGERLPSTRPVHLGAGSQNGVGVLYGTQHLSRTAKPTDDLLAFYDNQYAGRLTPLGGTGPVPSTGYEAYTAGRAGLFGLDQAAYPAVLQAATGSSAMEIALDAAERLFQLNDTAYVAVILGGHDTHQRSGADSADLHNDSLAGVVQQIMNRQATLGNVLVALTTEFGRRFEVGGDPSNHDPYAYANLLIPPTATIGSAHQVASGPPGAARWRPFDVRGLLLEHLGVDAVSALGSFPDASGVELDASRVQSFHNAFVA